MKRPRPNWKILREQLWERSEGRCEVSGLPLDPDTFDAHHRRPKGHGGTSRLDTDTLCNLLALDPQVHNGGKASVHGNRPRSEEHGWLLPQSTPIAGEWPVQLSDGRWVYLLADGRYIEV